jgi:hypothetical protein
MSPDAQLVAAVNNEGNCYIWQMEGADLCALKMIDAHKPSYALKCVFSPDSEKLVSRLGPAVEPFELFRHRPVLAVHPMRAAAAVPSPHPSSLRTD